jgi:hypothetical protein
LSVVVAESIRGAVNTRTAARDGGQTFTVGLATPQAPIVPVAYWASWDTDAYAGRRWADAQGKFDLRDQIEEHAWLSGKLRTFVADGTCTVVRSGTRIAKVYRGDGWDLAAVCADLGLVVDRTEG